MTEVRTQQPIETLHGHGIALSCATDGMLRSDALHGLFVADTRMISTYQVMLAGQQLELLARTRRGHGTAQWSFQNRPFRDRGRDIPGGVIAVDLRRRVHQAWHDDLTVTAYTERPIRATLVLQIDADFADIFEVKAQHLVPRLGVSRLITASGARLEYRRGDFQRAVEISFSHQPSASGARFIFDLEVSRSSGWQCCVDLTPIIAARPQRFLGDPHVEEDLDQTKVMVDGDAAVGRVFARGATDIAELRLETPHGTTVAAGVPWFQTLFGRDTVTESLMTGLLGCSLTRGTLGALAAHQATHVDDDRDAEPGKLPHELRQGELAYRHLIPHTPYYGNHDTQALYCLALWNAWRWTGDDDLLHNYLSTARAALEWCDSYGDRDGDGFQEYASRNNHGGYYNQSWKDAGDAILTDTGELAELPIATVELQGYLYAARLAMAELYLALGELHEAGAQYHLADVLARQVEESFYLPDAGYYAIALDGTKRALGTIASNAGHLLWCGLPTAERASIVAARLAQPDMFSGWGLRTLSAEHCSYNPLSYQLGSVWPHDTVLAAAGMARYGHYDHAHRLIQGIFDAANVFENDRLPELFCGFERNRATPVPYIEANVPQAWAAAAPILAVQILLGVVPDAPNGCCYLAPRLPEWIPKLAVYGIAVGDATLDVMLEHGRSPRFQVTSGQLDVRFAEPVSPLWGRPMHRPR